MPWRGPEHPGDFPTLAFQVIPWIEECVVIPDGYRRGHPYLLTNEMVRFLKRFYRIEPRTGQFRHYGAQLRRSQKWGKDPFMAAVILAEAMGPARFDGWDAYGDPVGAPYPTPYVPCLGVSEEQTSNTYGPLLDMIREGPLGNLPDMDAGETRVNLPGGGQIEPTTSSPRARLGQRMTFAGLTETHLWTPTSGGRKLGSAVKRNIAGMGGRWMEATNAWDPAEQSEAQVTGEGGERGVYVDSTESVRVVDLDDDAELMRELRRQYGDSNSEVVTRHPAGDFHGWTPLDRIVAEIRAPRTLEADARRYFLNEITAGMSDLADPTRWDAQARSDDPLRPGEAVCLGFDGSRSDDCTALVAVRIRDLRIFHLRTWLPADCPGGLVPRDEVDQAVADALDAYTVWHLYPDPFKWETYVDRWLALAGDNPAGETVVADFATNNQTRMDRAIRRFTTAFKGGELTHDGDPTLADHVKAAVIVKGSHRQAPPDEDGDPLARNYLKLGKRKPGMKIDGAVAAILAVAAAGKAVEEGALNEPEEVEPWAEYV